MLDKYMDYDRAIEKMLKARSDNEAALESLRSQLQEVIESMGSIRAIQYDKDRVQTSASDDAMANMIIKKQILEEKVSDIEKELDLVAKAWNQLTADEQRILYEFFQAGYYRTEDAVDILCDTYRYDRSTIFRKRRDAVKRVKTLMFG